MRTESFSKRYYFLFNDSSSGKGGVNSKTKRGRQMKECRLESPEDALTQDDVALKARQ